MLKRGQKMAEDAAVLLADFVSSLDNLPSEVHHILQEIGHKEGKTNDIKNRALARDQSLQRHARPVVQGGQGLLVPNPKEESMITKIRLDLDRAEATAKEKVALSERGVNLLSRHLQRLQAQLEVLTSTVPPLPTLPSFAPVAQAPPSAPTPYAGAGTPGGYAGQNQVPQFHGNPYAAAQFGLAGQGTPGAQSYAYGTPIDKRKTQPPQASPPIQVPLLPAQMQHGHPHAQSPGAGGYGYAGTPHAPGSGAAGAAANRIARGPGTPLGATGVPGHPGTPQLNLQQMQHEQQQRLALQQRQAQLQAQAHALAAQQMANQQQLAQLQRDQANGTPGGGGAGGGANGKAGTAAGKGQGGGNKRKRHEDEDASTETGGEEGGDGEDLTPYCFCHRPSFGEMIGCDAPTCAIEWFHLSCVGLKSTPEGSWYCSECQEKAAKQGGRRRK